MTIVIPYQEDIFHDGLELRFALRSIDSYLIGFTNLVLIGDKPEWYKGEYVQARDTEYRKQFSIYSKLLIACELNTVSDSFIMWNDDHYLLKGLYIGEIKYWYNGYLKDAYHGNNGVRYLETIKNTLKLLPDVLNYDIHTPIIYSKRLFKMMFSNKTDEFCIKSYYSNLVNGGGYCVNEQMTDCKINELLSKEAIQELIKDRLFFSTSTNGIKKPMIELMKELYPKQSQWER